MPRARRPASGRAFHGRRKVSITTSSASVPSPWGFDHRQQYPAVSRAEKPSAAFRRMAEGFGGFEDPELERLVVFPDHVRRALDAECVVDPVDETVRSGTA